MPQWTTLSEAALRQDGRLVEHGERVDVTDETAVLRDRPLGHLSGKRRDSSEWPRNRPPEFPVRIRGRG